MDKSYLRLVCGDPEGVCKKGPEKGDKKIEKDDKKTEEEDRKNCVSFTRFVFPFAYSLRRLPENPKEKDHLYYKEVSYEDLDENSLDRKIFIQRRKYFTRETGHSLYDRAKWFKVPPHIWKEKTSLATGVGFKSLHGDREFQVAMSPPMVVLFEWDGKERNEPGEENILQTGFLVAEVWFPKEREESGKEEKCSVFLDDLLDINELFRCFDYPGYKDHEDRFFKLLKNLPTEYGLKETKTIGNFEGDVHSAYFTRWGNLLSIPVWFDGAAYGLVPEDFTENAVKYLEDPLRDWEKGPLSPDKYLIYPDFRAFVWSCAVLENGAKAIGRALYTSQSKAHEYRYYVKFLNVDEPSSPCDAPPSEFEKEWARERTYHRWEKEGTWYGFNYHAGVAVMEPSVYVSHFREIYFDIILLLLYLRVTLFRFSNALEDIVKGRPSLKELRKGMEKIRKYFSVFAIRYQYPLLSNQQQAIEMYQIARKYLDVDEFYEEVKREIDDTHGYLETVTANRLSELGNKIARWGIPLAVAGIVASIFGMDTEHLHVWESLSTGFGLRPNPEFWVLFMLVVFLAGLSFFWVRNWFREKDKDSS